MIRVLILISTILVLSGCFQKTYISPRLHTWIENYYIPEAHYEGSYKFLVLAKKGSGYTTRYKFDQIHLNFRVTELLEQCEKDLYDVNFTAPCKILYLGNQQIFYSTDDELNKHIEEYKERLKGKKKPQANGLADWSKEKLLSKACNEETNDWDKDYPVAINEAKRRGINCSQ